MNVWGIDSLICSDTNPNIFFNGDLSTLTLNKTSSFIIYKFSKCSNGTNEADNGA